MLSSVLIYCGPPALPAGEALVGVGGGGGVGVEGVVTARAGPALYSVLATSLPTLCLLKLEHTKQPMPATKSPPAETRR